MRSRNMFVARKRRKSEIMRVDAEFKKIVEEISRQTGLSQTDVTRLLTLKLLEDNGKDIFEKRWL